MSASALRSERSWTKSWASSRAWIWPIERWCVDEKALDVEILGQKFTISSDAEEGYMLKVAGYVDGKMQELMRASKSVAKTNVAMLAALNIADEYHRLKDTHEAILHRLEQLSKKVAMTLTDEG